MKEFCNTMARIAPKKFGSWITKLAVFLIFSMLSINSLTLVRLSIHITTCLTEALAYGVAIPQGFLHPPGLLLMLLDAVRSQRTWLVGMFDQR
jgi:hypothetical protein